MSTHTPTNEEGLIEELQDLKPDEVIYLYPNEDKWIEVLILPLNWSPYEIDLNNPDVRRKYLKRSFKAIEMHKEVWKASGEIARHYR